MRIHPQESGEANQHVLERFAQRRNQAADITGQEVVVYSRENGLNSPAEGSIPGCPRMNIFIL